MDIKTEIIYEKDKNPKFLHKVHYKIKEELDVNT